MKRIYVVPWYSTKRAKIMPHYINGSGGSGGKYLDFAATNSTTLYWYNTTMTTTAFTDTVWLSLWNDGTTNTTTSITIGSCGGSIWQSWQMPAERTRAEIEADRVRALADHAQREREHREAELRASTLLQSVLTADERAMFLAEGHIVVSGRSGRRYRLRQARSGNIDVVDRSGLLLHRLCCHPNQDMPHCDVMLAQKLWLETNEDEFLRLANRHAPLQRDQIILPSVIA